MVYNGDSNGQDICTLTDDICNTTVTLYPLAEKTRAANKTSKAVWAWIFDAYGGWEYDDSNNTTDLPIALTGLNINQSDYDVPPTALTVRGVEILPFGGTVFQHLKELTEEILTERGISEASLFTASGVPLYYRPIGNSIKLYPSANYTQTGSLRVTFDRGSTSFIPTDTTKQPGFASEFHEIISVGMSLEYARRNALSSLQGIMADYMDFKNRITKYYSSRYQEKFPARITVSDMTIEYI